MTLWDEDIPGVPPITLTTYLKYRFDTGELSEIALCRVVPVMVDEKVAAAAVFVTSDMNLASRALVCDGDRNIVCVQARHHLV